jgi:chromosome segregation ATPase
MSKPARRKDLNELDRSLERIEDVLSSHGATMVTIRRELERQPLAPDVDRLETLLNGVKVALERVGGNVVPSLTQDIHALRDEMTALRHEMIDYQSVLMDLKDWLDHLPVAAGEAKPLSRATEGKRRYNRRKKGAQEDHPQVENSGQDAALHNGQSENDNGA